MSQSPSAPSVGQVSADRQFRWDGVQWVPIPRGEREATPWTRPMQLAAAGLLAVVAVVTFATTLIYYNHDAVKSTLEAANTQIPQGTTEDQVITFTIAGAIGFAVVVALVELFGALGAFLRWRWAFWYVLVLMGLGSLSALLGLFGLFQSTTGSPIPKGVEVVNELLALGAVAMLVWMIVGVSRYGPWAMKRPGA
ncbi:MAG TPA: hypothetical protein VJR46_03195 [Candidatus Dormibacteraeota bacterium]|nr:hypothetical protein [Candidatus Dormibacteraeota bacterium]